MSDKSRVFISYASDDYEIAKRIYDDLKNAGVSPWLDREDLLPGQNWRTVIPQVIRDCRYFLLLISNYSVSKMGYIQKEQRIALELFDEFPSNEIFIIPARIDNTEPIDERLRNLHWADLSDYESGIRNILKTINIDTSLSISKDTNRISVSEALEQNDEKLINILNKVEGLASLISKIDEADDLFSKFQGLTKYASKIIPLLKYISNVLEYAINNYEPNLYYSSLKNALQSMDIVKKELDAIEHYLIQHWQNIIDKFYKIISDELLKKYARINTLVGVINPYLTGNPIKYTANKLFKGRLSNRDTIVAAFWERHRPTLVLHGPRRMGKTSFLLQLPALLLGHTIPAFVDLQRPACTQSNASFMYSVAKAISNDSRPYRIIIDSPEREPFDRSPFEAFESWLEKSALSKLQGFNMLMTFDEFEKLGEAIEKGKLNFDILDELRHLIQHQSKMAFLFAGIHTMDELGPDWSSYFINIKPVQMGYLKEDEARELIVNPDPQSGFDLIRNRFQNIFKCDKDDKNIFMTEFR